MNRVFLCLSHRTHLLKNILPISKLIYITFWFDGKFYSRTCSGVDPLSGVHTKCCQLLHLLSRTITKVNDWTKHASAKSHDTSGLYPETKTMTEFKTLQRKVTTLWGYTWRQSTRSTTEWWFLSAERFKDHEGQGAFGVSEGVAPAPYSTTRGWGEGKERQRDSDLSQINFEDFRLVLYICKVKQSKGKVFLYCRQVCLCQINAYGLWEVKVLQIKQKTSYKSCLSDLFVDRYYYYRFVVWSNNLLFMFIDWLLLKFIIILIDYHSYWLFYLIEFQRESL